MKGDRDVDVRQLRRVVKEENRGTLLFNGREFSYVVLDTEFEYPTISYREITNDDFDAWKIGLVTDFHNFISGSK